MVRMAAPKQMKVDPTTRLTQRDRSGRVSTPLALEAGAAYRLKDATDNAMNIEVRIRNCGSSVAHWSMNCGNSAVKNIVALGLVSAVRKADLYSLKRVGLFFFEPSSMPSAKLNSIGDVDRKLKPNRRRQISQEPAMNTLS